MKEHCGKYTAKEVEKALSHFKMLPHNKNYVRQYLIDGVRLKDLACSKQQALARIKKVLKKLK